MNPGSNEARVVITGMGILSPIGNSPDEVLKSILRGETAVRPNGLVVRGKPVYSGTIVPGAVPEGESDPSIDRTGRLAVEAARRALADAFGGDTGDLDPNTIGLALGTSHGGRSQLDRLAEEAGDPFTERAASRFAVVAAHQSQTWAVVQALGIGGPVVTLSNACSSSGSSLEVGLNWLRSGRCRVAIVGGADGYAHLTQAGFAALGATSAGPNAPFSQPVGISLGEAAGFVVLETLEHALARGATIHAELFACASTWDGYHLTEPDPSGDGLARALTLAEARSGVGRETIGFVHAHGTGTRLNDTAECRALSRFFGDAAPPVYSSKAMTGHVLGASAVVGLVASIVSMNHGLVPPTVNFTEPRPGCPFDFVPNRAREQAVARFVVEVAGFGGANSVAMVGLPSPRAVERRPDRPSDEVVITGLGVVSPLGADSGTVASALESGRKAGAFVGRFDTSAHAARHAALVDGSTLRKNSAALGLRRVDAVVEYAAVAAAAACRQAGLSPLADGNGERIGLVIGTTRGEAARFEAYLESARGGVWDQASPLHFPHLVMSALGGQVSKALGFKGLALTVVDGETAGLHALCHAASALAMHDDLDAVVVVAADEWTPRLHGCLDRLGRLAPSGEGDEGPRATPYDPEAAGAFPAEGAVAVVLERASVAQSRGARPLAQLEGWSLAAASRPSCVSTTLARSAREALGSTDRPVDLVVGCGRGRPSYDRAECEGLSTALRSIESESAYPATSPTSSLGFAEAASGLFAVATGLWAMERGMAPPVSAQPPCSEGDPLEWIGPEARQGDYGRVLVAGATDLGNRAAVVLTHPEFGL